MVDPRRHAAALLAVLLLAAPASAQEPTLLAQMPTPTPESQPPLSEDPPENLGEGEEQTTPGTPDAEPTGKLAETGLEAGLIALLGLGLIASGSGLRVTLGRGD